MKDIVWFISALWAFIVVTSGALIPMAFAVHYSNGREWIMALGFIASAISGFCIDYHFVNPEKYKD